MLKKDVPGCNDFLVQETCLCIWNFSSVIFYTGEFTILELVLLSTVVERVLIETHSPSRILSQSQESAARYFVHYVTDLHYLSQGSLGN